MLVAVKKNICIIPLALEVSLCDSVPCLRSMILGNVFGLIWNGEVIVWVRSSVVPSELFLDVSRRTLLEKAAVVLYMLNG